MEEEVRSLPSVLVTTLSLEENFNHVRGAFFTYFGTFVFVMDVFQERLKVETTVVLRPPEKLQLILSL